MEKIFKIAIFAKEEDKFKLVGYKDYTLNFTQPSGKGRMRIIVNGRWSKHVLQLRSGLDSYKKRILRAISDFENDRITSNCTDTCYVTRKYINTHFKKAECRKFFNRIDPITKESSRDELTQYELININDNGVNNRRDKCGGETDVYYGFSI